MTYRLLFLILFISACTKEGLDGNTTLVATLKHHDRIIYNTADHPDSVFVKFNTKESPGTLPSDYDAVFTGTTGESHVHIEHLKPGCYFLFAVGMDTAINERVKGGIPITIKAKEKNSTLHIEIPITEH